MNNSTCSSDYESICLQIKNVKNDIANALLERENIRLQINPQIASEYALKVGCWENELLCAQLAARRAKRKVELAQAQINAGNTFDSKELESTLDKEFEVWEEKVRVALSEYSRAIERRQNSRTLSPSEATELKQLHRTLIKRLHPDLHSGQTEEQTHMFLLAQAAFEAGDIETLRSLIVATTSLESTETLPPSIDEAEAELALCQAQLTVAKESLETLKKENPYALGALLSDGAWVIEKVSDLKRQIEEQKEAKSRFDKRFVELQSEQIE